MCVWKIESAEAKRNEGRTAGTIQVDKQKQRVHTSFTHNSHTVQYSTVQWRDKLSYSRDQRVTVMSEVRREKERRDSGCLGLNEIQ